MRVFPLIFIFVILTLEETLGCHAVDSVTNEKYKFDDCSFILFSLSLSRLVLKARRERLSWGPRHLLIITLVKRRRERENLEVMGLCCNKS